MEAEKAAIAQADDTTADEVESREVTFSVVEEDEPKDESKA